MVFLSSGKTGLGLATPGCCLLHCLSIAAYVCSWPWPVFLQTATCTALPQGFVHSLSTYCMRGTVCPPNTPQGSCIITLLYIYAVGEDLNLFSLKPGILTGSFRNGLPHVCKALRLQQQLVQRISCGRQQAGQRMRDFPQCGPSQICSNAPMGSANSVGLSCAEEQVALGSAGTQPAGWPFEGESSQYVFIPFREQRR